MKKHLWLFRHAHLICLRFMNGKNEGNINYCMATRVGIYDLYTSGLWARFLWLTFFGAKNDLILFLFTICNAFIYSIQNRYEFFDWTFRLPRNKRELCTQKIDSRRKMNFLLNSEIFHQTERKYTSFPPRQSKETVRRKLFLFGA